MMAMHARTGVTRQPLSVLTGNVAGTRNFVEQHVANDRFLIQVVVSRHQHMAAAQYRADWIDRDDAPQALVTTATYWSTNYAIPVRLAVIKGCLLFMLLLTFLHDRRMRSAETAREQLKGASSGDSSSHSEIRLRGRMYVLLVEWPSIFGPVILEVTRYQLSLPNWHFCVAVVIGI